MLLDSRNRNVIVYLPPNYLASSTTRYPVVYLLHGYNGTNTSWTQGAYQGFSVQTAMDRLISEGTLREMIVVMPDARNAYGGSYYTNSSVAGNWEDLMTRDLVQYIDTHYRTLPQAASRGIAGQSMGDYGAICLAFKHPDVYSAVFGTSACCLDFVADLEKENLEWLRILSLNSRKQLGTLPQMGNHWKGNYPNALMGLAAAVSPNPDRPPFFVDLPFELVGRDVRRVEATYRRWLEHFPAAMVPQYQAKLRQLRGICFAAGKADRLVHIPQGSRSLSKALKAHGIAHQFEEYDSDHGGLVREWMERKVLPFFSSILAFEGATK